jgi:hypothetical protein
MFGSVVNFSIYIILLAAQPPTEMSIRNQKRIFLGIKVRPVRRAGLTVVCELIDGQLAARGLDLLRPPPGLGFILKNLDFTTVKA